MPHALIIEDNMIVGHAIEQQLAHAGFRSFDHAWTETQAFEHAGARLPDLIVVGDGMEEGAALEVACAIGGRNNAPVLLATTNPFRTGDSLPRGLAVHGPCRIDEIGQMIHRALTGIDQESFALS